jgi:hypothetical protein
VPWMKGSTAPMAPYPLGGWDRGRGPEGIRAMGDWDRGRGPEGTRAMGDWDRGSEPEGMRVMEGIGAIDRPSDSLLTTSKAWLGCMCNRFVIADTVFPFAYASRYFPKVTNINNIPEASKNTCFVGSPVLQARES